MADPRITSMKMGSTNDLPRRWVIPQTFRFTNSKTDEESGNNRMQIPFTRYGIVAIHLYTSVTKSNVSFDIRMISQAATANTTQLTFSALTLDTSGAQVYHCHSESGKSWKFVDDAHSYSDTYQITFADGYAFSQQDDDSFVVSDNRGVLPGFVLGTTCDGVIVAHLIVDQLSDDL